MEEVIQSFMQGNSARLGEPPMSREDAITKIKRLISDRYPTATIVEEDGKVYVHG